MKPTISEITACVSAWGMLKFFPADPEAREGIMGLLANMVGTSHQLAWLKGAMINRVGEWPGPAQLRALFCTQFPPADGIEGPDCQLHGDTPEEIAAEKPRYEALPAPEAQRLLATIPKPTSEPPLSDEERASMNELNAKVRAKAQAERDRQHQLDEAAR